MTHLDLFSGIGGFAYAADQVWENMNHVFCDNDRFCQQVLKKHWPEAKIYGNIKEINTNPFSTRLERSKQQTTRHDRQLNPEQCHKTPFLLTGGFPCQPFSAAGLRRGTADERHLWPEMLRVIRLTHPTWIIAENVRGILTWNDGLQFEQVCLDLEAESYEVQTFIIPAVGVNAPHRRDRVWFVAHARRLRGSARSSPGLRPKRQVSEQSNRFKSSAWKREWHEVAAEFCSVDDGLSVELGEFKLSKAQHRKEQLKAYGNAIVPAVAIEIMRAIKQTTGK